MTPASLPAAIRNDAELYEGNLTHYARVLFHHAQNLNHPYHNFRHMFHVFWLVHDACQYYDEQYRQGATTRLTKRVMRNMLIAALFHDFNHSGLFGDDDLNIERAIRGLRKHAQDEDREELIVIENMIRSTQYPYVESACELNLPRLVLRDADVSQAFSVAWIQQVVFGLAAEWGKTPIDVLRMQEPFLKNLVFQTEWAKQRFTQADVSAKIEEARELLDLLGPTPDGEMPLGKLVQIGWEYSYYYGDNSSIPGWSPWERLEPRNPRIDTVEGRAREIRQYIADGKKYKLRALYAPADS